MAPILAGLHVQQLIIGIPGLLVAIVLHEVAHALVSTWLGDPTPGMQGRLSLNPLAHIDWIGMLMLWLFRFGWAKPVQIDPRYYRNQQVGMLLVALAGPAMNALIALVGLVLIHRIAWPSVGLGASLLTILNYVVLYDVFFAVFNILPIPPLDGSRILASLSVEGARLMSAVEPWGWVLLLLLIVTGIITRILSPMAEGLASVLAALARAI